MPKCPECKHKFSDSEAVEGIRMALDDLQSAVNEMTWRANRVHEAIRELRGELHRIDENAKKVDRQRDQLRRLQELYDECRATRMGRSA